MNKQIFTGTEFFDEIIKDNGYYVDKTEMIYDLIENTKTKVSLFTRPRRFGKTLTLTMMESFFDISRDSRSVFSGLDIMEHEDFCSEHMNKYPTLFISLKDVEGLTFASASRKMEICIADLCKKVRFLEHDEKSDLADREKFTRLISEKGDAEDIQNSLKTISRMMYEHYGMPVVLLIDEYDVPLAKAHVNGFYREMLDLIRGFMSTSLKTNEYLKLAVVTGCLRIPKESIFTGVNNFAAYSVLDSEFSQYFGFTENEMKQMLSDFGKSDKLDTVKEWYDGYVFGDTEIYCPWDAGRYVSSIVNRPNAKPKSYWVNTSGNDAISRFFDMDGADISPKFEALLNGGTITENVTNALTYDQAYTSENNLWSILLMTGYLTPAAVPEWDESEGSGNVELRIPNKEISFIFRNAVVDHFKKTLDDSEQRSLMDALWDSDEKRASEIISDMLWNTISYMDYHEDYYHAFLAGVFVGRGGYSVQSNRESGLGRPDIVLKDRKNRRALVIEAKKSDSTENMAKCCTDAIEQISANGYGTDLDGYRQILCCGISFYKKEAMVKIMK